MLFWLVSCDAGFHKLLHIDLRFLRPLVKGDLDDAFGLGRLLRVFLFYFLEFSLQLCL